MAQPNWCYWNT